MAEILLTSETFVKSVTSISDNVAGKYMRPSMREAQESGLRGILGDCLFDKLKALAAKGDDGRAIDLPENAAYKDLLDRAQYYLAYQTVVELIPKVSNKIGNFGVAKSNDENLTVLPLEEQGKQQYYYQAKADGHCRRLQRWILQNKASFPELRACDCAAMQANLRSAASCGMWLGGARGKIGPGGGGCC